MRDVLKRLEEAVKVHLGVLTSPDNILVNDVIVGLANMRISHIIKLGKTLELVRSDEVIVFLSSQHFKDGLSL